MMKDLGFSYGDGEYDLYPLYPQCKRKARVYCADMNTDNPLEYITLSAGRDTNYGQDYREHQPYKRGKTAYDKVCVSCHAFVVNPNHTFFRNIANNWHYLNVSQKLFEEIVTDSSHKLLV